MVRLVMILLGVDYLRTRWWTLTTLGWISLVLGIAIFIDVLDSALYFPITPFACLLLLEGGATLAVAWTGMGGQRTLRYVKGLAFCVAAALILAGHHHGNFILSMIFGALFLADGLLQIISARVVRYRTWRLAVAGGVVEIASTVQVRIRNYDPERLRRFWEAYRQDTTYNLTHRNCSSTVSRALEAALEGTSARVWGHRHGWRPFLRVIATPELWVAAQVRKRAATMAWTPGLTLDYARALSMLADPRPSGWVKMAHLALATMYRSRQQWAEEQRTAPNLHETEHTDTAGRIV